MRFSSSFKVGFLTLVSLFILIFTILLSVTGIIVDVRGRARFAEDN